MTSNKQRYYIGVDVGTQSVRGGLITHNGEIVCTASVPIHTWNPSPNYYEQSSDFIWNACVKVIKEVTSTVDKSAIRGIGFDATCSLVVLDENFQPLSVSRSENPEQNIIVWMDHRAAEEAQFITALEHPSLKYIGWEMSPEMEPPKLLWLKRNMPNQWKKAGHFFDLPDFLTWKATGSLTRSLCSLVCKWLFQAETEDDNGWQDEFWIDIGLEDVLCDGYRKIGSVALHPGDCCGQGLTDKVAKELDLLPGTSVSASIIDAHAGALSVLACCDEWNMIENKLAIICGTSTCHLKLHKEPLFTRGVWGPYLSVMVPNYWCSEAGQSAAGALLDHVISQHPAAQQLKQECGDNRHVTDILNEKLESMKSAQGLSSVSRLASDFHVWPDYHGNRSPLADTDLMGMICGLTLSNDVDSLAVQYLATVQALAYSTKHIIKSLEETGHKIDVLILCGGLSKNDLYVQLHADITNLPVVIPEVSEPVLLGAAMLASTAAGDNRFVTEAMQSMCGTGTIGMPYAPDYLFHYQKYKSFLNLLQCQRNIRSNMMIAA